MITLRKGQSRSFSPSRSPDRLKEDRFDYGARLRLVAWSELPDTLDVYEGSGEVRTGLFCANNPVNLIDPSGQIVPFIVGALATGASAYKLIAGAGKAYYSASAQVDAIAAYNNAYRGVLNRYGCPDQVPESVQNTLNQWGSDLATQFGPGIAPAITGISGSILTGPASTTPGVSPGSPTPSPMPFPNSPSFSPPWYGRGLPTSP